MSRSFSAARGPTTAATSSRGAPEDGANSNSRCGGRQARCLDRFLRPEARLRRQLRATGAELPRCPLRAPGLADEHASSSALGEWNRPAGSAPLESALRWPAPLPFPVRVIEVPPSVHRRLPKADEMAFFEYTAKNVGIRRAHGEFVLATNPDNVFEPAVVDVLAGRELSRLIVSTRVRTVRYSVSDPEGDGGGTPRVLPWKYLARQHTRPNCCLRHSPPGRWTSRPRQLRRALSRRPEELAHSERAGVHGFTATRPATSS